MKIPTREEIADWIEKHCKDKTDLNLIGLYDPESGCPISISNDGSIDITLFADSKRKTNQIVMLLKHCALHFGRTHEPEVFIDENLNEDFLSPKYGKTYYEIEVCFNALNRPRVKPTTKKKGK